MTWYFNNDGVADGPYEDEAMAALLAQNRIRGHTLVWQVGGEAWQEIAAQAPNWWQPVTTAQADVVVSSRPPTTRGLVPNAPVVEAKPAASGGFLKKMFGFGGGKK
ncbi:MAG: DUF4339 domain-containing protein [Verrucomicrobiota bacterium]